VLSRQGGDCRLAAPTFSQAGAAADSGALAANTRGHDKRSSFGNRRLA